MAKDDDLERERTAARLDGPEAVPLFAGFMMAAIASGKSAKAASNLKPRVIHGEDAVNMDKEMAIMAKNTLSYNALTTVLQKGFEGVKNVIADGGRS